MDKSIVSPFLTNGVYLSVCSSVRWIQGVTDCGAQ